MSKERISRPAHLAREFDKPLFTAAHFGFHPIECPKVTEADQKAVKDCIPPEATALEHRLFDAAEKAAFIRTYLEKELSSLAHPLAVSWRKKPAGAKLFDYSLELVGFPPGVAEALLIRTALTLIEEEGHKDAVVLVNSIGDKDSVVAYERELHAFARKHFGEFGPELKKRLKGNIFALVTDKSPDTDAVREEIPSSIAFLSSTSRSHLKETLEYLEALNIEFRVEPTLVGMANYCSEIVFSVRSKEDESRIYASGFRYSRLGKRFGLKKDASFIGMTVFGDALHDKKIPAASKSFTDLPRPRFYLVQLGRDAKMKALPMIESLRANRIAIYHFLGKDKITAQLGNAENLKVSHLIIIGQKEAYDNTATIRNMTTRAQNTIPMKDLAGYLKNIEL